jgi:cell filamentation protein
VTSEGYDAFDDPYAYPGATVLKNILDLRDPDTLEAFEVEISTLRAEEPLPEGNFDAAHYCAVHHHLFQDVYDWAGQYRTVRTSKGGNLFCYPENIRSQMDELFRGLRGGAHFANHNTEDFITQITLFLGELNAIHPFREGNGRSQLAFVGLIGVTYGRTFDFERIDRTTFLPAMIASYFGKRAPLAAELTNLLS